MRKSELYFRMTVAIDGQDWIARLALAEALDRLSTKDLAEVLAHAESARQKYDEKRKDLQQERFGRPSRLS